MSKHVCTDIFHEPTTLAHCNNHPKWSVVRNAGGQWLVYGVYAIDSVAGFATWAGAFAYAYDLAGLAAREATR